MAFRTQDAYHFVNNSVQPNPDKTEYEFECMKRLLMGLGEAKNYPRVRDALPADLPEETFSTLEELQFFMAHYFLDEKNEEKNEDSRMIPYQEQPFNNNNPNSTDSTDLFFKKLDQVSKGLTVPQHNIILDEIRAFSMMVAQSSKEDIQEYNKRINKDLLLIEEGEPKRIIRELLTFQAKFIIRVQTDPEILSYLKSSNNLLISDNALEQERTKGANMYKELGTYVGGRTFDITVSAGSGVLGWYTATKITTVGKLATGLLGGLSEYLSNPILPGDTGGAGMCSTPIDENASWLSGETFRSVACTISGGAGKGLGAIVKTTEDTMDGTHLLFGMIVGLFIFLLLSIARRHGALKFRSGLSQQELDLDYEIEKLIDSLKIAT